MKHKNIKHEGGFTLVELLIVIAIIGVIASVVLVSFTETKARSRDARRVEDIGQIKSALSLYAATNNKFPDCPSGEVVIGGGSDSCIRDSLINSGNIPAMPMDPMGRGNGVAGDCGVSVGVYVYCYASVDGLDYTLKYHLEKAVSDLAPGWHSISP